ENQLNRHQDDDDVPADEHPENADGDQREAENHEMVLGYGHFVATSGIRSWDGPARWPRSWPRAGAPRRPRTETCIPGTTRGPSRGVPPPPAGRRAESGPPRGGRTGPPASRTGGA